MLSVPSAITATALAVVLSIAASAASHADPSPPPLTLKPISGPGAGPGQAALLNIKVGRKQTVSYFFNAGGICRLTVMAGDAMIGEDVPDESTLRVEIELAPAKSIVLDTAEGKGLQFACLSGAQAMSVTPFDQIAGYPVPM